MLLQLHARKVNSCTGTYNERKFVIVTTVSQIPLKMANSKYNTGHVQIKD